VSRCPANVELDDLISVGTLGLLSAAERFNPAYGKPFRFYAELRIRGEIVDEMRANDWVPRTRRQKFEMIDKARQMLEKEKGAAVSDGEVAEAIGMSLKKLQATTDRTRSGNFLSLEDLGVNGDDPQLDLLEALHGDAPDPGAVLLGRELEETLAEAIQSLPPREKTLLMLYYFQDLQQKEIGVVLGVTESRISQLHARALARLRHRLPKGEG